MPGAFQFYRLLNALSIDVVIGAVISALFFAREHSISLSPSICVALGLTVWIIYTVDHLRDAKKIRKPAATYRHQFHQRYFKPVSYFLAFVVVIDVVVVWMLPQQVFYFGAALATGVLAYLLAWRHLRFMKEFYVALLYTAGIILPTATLAEGPLTIFSGVLSLQLFLLAFINLLIFSWFDRISDRHNEQHSFVTRAGEKTSRICIWILTALTLLMSALMMIIFKDRFLPSVITAAMGAGFLLIFFYRASLEKFDAYRSAGDAVFMVPVFSLFSVG
jgi:4-hydroxybenzoate polyprenyltransferase